ncbi:MAG: hypothetical protein ACQESJ_05100 [Bacteroidota bacterium]
MKKLEDIIRKNREKFDDLEPAEGHFERFQSKLNRYNNKKPSTFFSYKFVLKAAVVGLLVVLSSLWLYDNIYDKHSTDQIAMENASPEFREAQVYYSGMVKKKYNQIQDFDFKSKKQKKMLMNELKAMDSIYYNIKQDFEEHPNDPRVMNALIKHYQMKLDVMTQVLEQLNQVQAIKNRDKDNKNNKNDKSHENKEL